MKRDICFLLTLDVGQIPIEKHYRSFTITEKFILISRAIPYILKLKPTLSDALYKSQWEFAFCIEI